MLMPAAVLVVVILGALAVDQSLVFNAQRDLVATAEATANDAAAAGVDVGGVRDGQEVGYDRAAVDAVVRRQVAAADGEVTGSWEVQGTTLVVRFRRRVELVFTGGLGRDRTRTVTATARADLRHLAPR